MSELLSELIKICPACDEENPATEVMCRVCMTNLSSVAPSSKKNDLPPVSDDENGGDLPDTSYTVISRPEVLTLSLVSGNGAISVQSGCVLGRKGDTGDFFETFRMVSRHHARASFVNGAWNVEDLGSTNGTWLNGERLPDGERRILQRGDTLALSLACEMKVMY